MSTSAVPPPLPPGQSTPPPSGQWAYPVDEKGDPKKHYVRWLVFGSAGCFVAVLGLGLAATLLVPYISRGIEAGRREKASIQLGDLREALETYASAHAGAYPEALEALVTPDAQGHTILRDERELPRDPWGREYVYEAPAPPHSKPRLRTLGRDGKPGGSGPDEDLYAAEAADVR